MHTGIRMQPCNTKSKQCLEQLLLCRYKQKEKRKNPYFEQTDDYNKKAKLIV